MPRVTLTDDELSSVIDLVVAEIDRLRGLLAGAEAGGPDDVEWRHTESELLELMEKLEDA